MIIIIYLLVAFVFGWLCAAMATARGRNPLLWSILGIIFGIFAVIVLALMGTNAKGLAALAAQTEANPAPGSTIDALTKLNQLRNDGAISETQFETQKVKLLGDDREDG